jgi:hypothetical protein
MHTVIKAAQVRSIDNKSSKSKEESKDGVRPEIKAVREVIGSLELKSMQQLADERSGMPMTASEKSYLPLKNVALSRCKDKLQSVRFR